MSNDVNAPVKINQKTLEAQVEKGMKKQELAELYNLPVAQMTKVLQSAGLKIRKFHAPKFILVDEEEVEDVEKEEVTQDVEETSEETASTGSWTD